MPLGTRAPVDFAHLTDPYYATVLNGLLLAMKYHVIEALQFC